MVVTNSSKCGLSAGELIPRVVEPLGVPRFPFALVIAVLIFTAAPRVVADSRSAGEPPGVIRISPYTVAAITTGADGNVYVARRLATGIFRPAVGGPILSIATIDNPLMLAAAPNGAIWFETSGYFAYAMPGGAVTKVLDHPLPPNILFPPQFSIATDGALWYADGATLRRRDPGGSTLTISMPGTIRLTAPSSSGAVWVTRELGQVLYRVSSTGAIQSFPVVSGWKIASMPDGSVWVSLFPGGWAARVVAHISISGQELERITDFLPDALASAPDGALLLARQQEIARYANGQMTRVNFPALPASPPGCFAYPSYPYLAGESNGAIWAGQTASSAVMLPEGDPCSNFTFPPDASALIQIPAAVATNVPALPPAALAGLIVVLAAIALVRAR